MNPEKCIASYVLVAQLNDHLSEDGECVRILKRLGERVNLLTMGNSMQELIKKADAFGKSSPPPDPTQLASSLVGLAKTLIPLANDVVKKQAEYIELIDTNRDYVTALEERCEALSSELKTSGADVSKFTPIPKP